jgi:hypothetical protein
MKKHWLYLVISLFAAAVFFFSNAGLRGYLRCNTCLGKEILSAPDSLYQYKLSAKAPFKYRMLFPTIVKTTHSIVFGKTNSDGFYYTYKFWSLFFYVTASCLLFYLMTVAGFSETLSFFGSILFVLLPPMLMAYTLPVHTREDPLAYTILIGGLIFLVKDYKWLFVMTAAIGVLCRETLLLLPMMYFFFSEDDKWIRRFFIAGFPCAVWLALRLSMGHEEYDVAEGFRWNNNNPEQVVGFLFITFNLCWIPFLIHMLNFRRNTATSNKVRRFFFRSSWLALTVILLTTYFGGIYNEIRLLYLLAPWMILITLDFLERNMDAFKVIVFKKGYLAFAVIVVALCALLMVIVLKHQEKLIIPGKYNVPYHLWIVVSVIYICITVIFTPVSWKIYLLNKKRDV